MIHRFSKHHEMELLVLLNHEFLTQVFSLFFCGPKRTKRSFSSGSVETVGDIHVSFARKIFLTAHFRGISNQPFPRRQSINLNFGVSNIENTKRF